MSWRRPSAEGFDLPKANCCGKSSSSASENQQQKIQLEQDASLWNENARLRAAVGWPQQTFWKVRLARVIARDPANWWRSVQIDLGERDGVRTNFPVRTSDGLVGRIQSVSETRSQVILLGDPDLRGRHGRNEQ